MRIIDGAQYSDAWWASRCGVPTASQFSRIFTGKGEPSKQRTAYLYELAAQRITGQQEETYKATAMALGTEREADARRVYAMTDEVVVEEVGLLLSDCGRYGASPDGLIGEAGCLEIKCPMGKTAVEYLMKGSLPPAYMQQVYGQLLVTGREWCDFVSYYPGLPLFIVRVVRGKELLSKVRTEIESFCSELDELYAAIRSIDR